MHRFFSRLSFTILLLAFIVSFIWFGIQFWDKNRTVEETDNAYLRTDIVAIAPKISGYISAMLVSDNQTVQAGDELFRLHPSDYQAKVAHAEAALLAAQAANGLLREEVVLQKVLIREAEARVVAAQAEVRRSSRDRNRADNLVRSGWATAKRQDSAVAIEVKARAATTQAKAGLHAKRQQLNVLHAKSKEVEARVKQAKAQLDLAELSLADTIIHAPVSGIIGNKHSDTGDFARSGATLLSIVPMQDIWVIANFKETQLARLALGQRAEIKVDTFGGTILTGHVESVAPATGAEFSLLPPENATGNFIRTVQRVPVKIKLNLNEVAAKRLRPGFSAKVTVFVSDTPPLSIGSIYDPAYLLASFFSLLE